MNSLLQDTRYALHRSFLPVAAILVCLSSSASAQTATTPVPASSKVNAEMRLPSQRGEGYRLFDRTFRGWYPRPSRRLFSMATTLIVADRGERIRYAILPSSEFCRVNLHLILTFNNLTAHGIPPKHLNSRARRMSFG
jgi:hypothetical protein